MLLCRTGEKSIMVGRGNSQATRKVFKGSKLGLDQDMRGFLTFLDAACDGGKVTTWYMRYL